MDSIVSGVLVGVGFNMLLFYITHSSPFSIRLWVNVYPSLPHFTLKLFLVSGDIATAKTFSFKIGWKIHFAIEKNQFCGEYFRYLYFECLYQNELEVGLLPTPHQNDSPLNIGLIKQSNTRRHCGDSDSPSAHRVIF